MKMTKTVSGWCSITFLLFTLFSFMMPLAAQGGNFYTIGPCGDYLRVRDMSINETTGKHHYQFRSNCVRSEVFVTHSGAPSYVQKKDVEAEISWSFDPATGKLQEYISPTSGSGFLSVIFKCTPYGEGLRFHSCSKIGADANTGVASFGYEPYWMGRPGPHYPITRKTAVDNQISAYITKKRKKGEISLPAPVVGTPKAGKQYPMSEIFPIQINKAELEPSVWYKLAKLYGNLKMYPEDYFGVEIDVFMPKEGGGGKWHKYAEKYVIYGSQWSGIYPEEGMYRIKARHYSNYGGPWSPWSLWRVFWVGDKVDYTKPVPILKKPVQGLIQTSGLVPFLALKAERMFEFTKADVEFSAHRMEMGIWKDYFEEDYLVGKTGVEKGHLLGTGLWRTRVRYAGGLNPWSEWHYFVEGNPPGGNGGTSANDYLPDLWVPADPTTDIRKEGKNWLIDMRIHYRGYRNLLQSGPIIKTMVACIPQTGGQTCGNTSPNPDIKYGGLNWVSINLFPGSGGESSEEPHHYLTKHTFWLRPFKPVGKWILLVSVDPDNFVHEGNEGNNITAWLFDSASQLIQNGLPALEEAIKKTKKLPEGLDEKMLKALRKNGGQSLSPGAFKAKLKTAGKHGKLGAADSKSKVKFGAMVQKHGAKIEPGSTHPPDPGKLKPATDMKTLPGKTVIGNKTATPLRQPQTLAKLSPHKLGAKLELRDANLVKTLKLTAGKTSEAIFRVMNSGDSSSKATPYSVECKKLSNAKSKCPVINKGRSLAIIGARGNADIKLKLTSLVAGEYELKLTLANGAEQTVKLKVAAAKLQVNPTTLKGTPKVQPKPRLRLP